GRKRSARGLGAPFSRPATSKRLVTSKLPWYAQLQLASSPFDHQLPSSPRPLQGCIQVGEVADRPTVHLGNDIAPPEAEPRRNRHAAHPDHDDTFRRIKPQFLSDGWTDVRYSRPVKGMVSGKIAEIRGLGCRNRNQNDVNLFRLPLADD